MSMDQLSKRLANTPEARWIRQMRDHYAKTGSYRPEDLLRLLGDPKRGVEMSPQPSLSKCFSRGQ